MAYCENEPVESLQFEYVISLKKKQNLICSLKT